MWLPGRRPLDLLVHGHLQYTGLRALYYTSIAGADPLLTEVKKSLWQLGFNPHVFKKNSQSKKTKGVDITLTKDMLSHAFHGNYEAAVLIAGDADYVPLVEEIKRLGKLVYLAFVGSQGLSPELRLSADSFTDITEQFASAWKQAPP